MCQKAGHSVTLFDPQGFEQKTLSLEADPRVWALGLRSTQLLAELGAWAPDERLCAYQSMHVIDARSDARVIFTEAALGHLVEADWIRNQLLSRLGGAGIDRGVRGIVSLFVSLGGIVVIMVGGAEL